MTFMPEIAAEAPATPWMQTCSGRVWSLLEPAPEQVWWPDIAEHLAKINRFLGATPGTVYSVAQHCCLVADILPTELRAYGLLHDAPEAFIADIPTPAKQALNLLGADHALWRLDDLQAQAIHTAADLPYPLSVADHGTVKKADLILLATERRDLQAECVAPWAMPLPPPLNRRITPWAWPKAADEWLSRLYRWVPAADRQRRSA